VSRRALAHITVGPVATPDLSDRPGEAPRVTMWEDASSRRFTEGTPAQ
jgi:hypothetical protein